MPLGGGGDVLVAVVDHAHRLADSLRQQGRVDGHDGREVLLSAEAAASLRLGDDSLCVTQVERALERRVDVVGALHGTGDGDAAVRPWLGDHGLVLDVELLLVADAVLARDDERGLREGSLGVAAADLIGGELLCRVERVEDRRQRLGARLMRRLASRRVALSGAARSATGSAWWRMMSAARAGMSSWMELTMFSPGISAAVMTTTFDQSKSGSSSSPSRRACASVERMVAPYQAPGNTRSSVYLASPVSLPGPSRRSGAGVASPSTGAAVSPGAGGDSTMGPSAVARWS